MYIMPNASVPLTVYPYHQWWDLLFGAPPSPHETVSLMGAGGKTTLLFLLAEELAQAGYAPVVATTTKIYRPKASEKLQVITADNIDAIRCALQKGIITVVGTPCDGKKLTVPVAGVLDSLQRQAQFLLLESDGSKRLPIKMPRAGEPVLWQGGGRLAVVCGLSCLGKPCAEVCHRAELAEKALGILPHHCLMPEDVVRILLHGYGMYREQAVFVINQADTDLLQQSAVEVAHLLLEAGVHRIAVTSLHKLSIQVFCR